MATAALEMALTDLELQNAGQSLKAAWGGQTETVLACKSLGMPADGALATLMAAVADAVDDHGTRAVKIKIGRSWSAVPLAALRMRWPASALTIVADANGSFRRHDLSVLRQLHELDVILEQPLPRDDLEGHAQLRAAGVTDVALDESIETVDDVERALAVGAAGIFVLKYGRLGGIAATHRLQHRLHEQGVSTRIGGMYATTVADVVERNLAAGALVSDLDPTRFTHDIGDASPAQGGVVRIPDHAGVASPSARAFLDSLMP